MSISAFSTIDQLVAAMDAGDLSSREATELALARIERLDARVNAYITVTAERALADADAADARRRAGERGGLLGVPIALKDLCDTAGIVTTGGSRILRDRVPDTDATVTRRLAQAGTVLLGKTHMAEFAYGFSHPDYGPSRTPWDTTRSASGSSGGSGAAVAAGLAWGAVGSDTGGSIRSPAAVCAITGHKPTYGLVSRAGVLPLTWSMDHVGPMARCARDAMLLLEAMAGHDPLDPASARIAAWSAPPTRRHDLRGLRIGLLTELLPGMDDECSAGFAAALDTLRALGATVEETPIPHHDLINDIAFGILEPEAAAWHAPWLAERPHDYAPQTRVGLQAAALMPATQYINALRLRARFCRDFKTLWERFDALVSPPQTDLPTLIADQEPTASSHQVWDLRHTVIANLTGMPAVVVPCFFTAASLPFGLQIMTAPFEDALALEIAEVFQSATDWHSRVPPGFQ